VSGATTTATKITTTIAAATGVDWRAKIKNILK